MQDLNERPVCHRAEDLVTYLYGEAGEADACDFRAHLEHCDACRSEFSTFSQMHESILTWRNEALGTSSNPAALAAEPTIDSTRFVRHQRKLSAFAALREFFSVSPLWLRGATAFAGLLFCALVVFAIYNGRQKPAPIMSQAADQKYTKADLDKAVADAKLQVMKARQPEPTKQILPAAPKPSPRTTLASARPAKPRIKGLTPQERQQLAADLRLIPSSDEEELPFGISDQPNQ